jgi:hypothetical protein
MLFATDTLTVTKIGATSLVGDISFVGSGVGLPYGSCYGVNIGWVQTAVSNTWYLISDSDMTDGELNNVTHDGDGKLTVTIAGRYLVNYGVTASLASANSEVNTTLVVNGSPLNQGRQGYDKLLADSRSNMSGSAILNFAANDTVEVAIQQIAGSDQDITVFHLNITLVQIGG